MDWRHVTASLGTPGTEKCNEPFQVTACNKTFGRRDLVKDTAVMTARLISLSLSLSLPRGLGMRIASELLETLILSLLLRSAYW